MHSLPPTLAPEIEHMGDSFDSTLARVEQLYRALKGLAKPPGTDLAASASSQNFLAARSAHGPYLSEETVRTTIADFVTVAEAVRDQFAHVEHRRKRTYAKERVPMEAAVRCLERANAELRSRNETLEAKFHELSALAQERLELLDTCAAEFSTRGARACRGLRTLEDALSGSTHDAQ
eukprot:gnl/Chilomastix_cuspidata/4898.p1 GENE.gnl/Chilomastix_cuspidata/4898~~gnl/Chilomastix_cuspidata/4898.p1  ORF type:complete len:178 (-),score=34.51 gnl/Chilomastix_cuspidata/4898:32-565(-)